MALAVASRMRRVMFTLVLASAYVAACASEADLAEDKRAILDSCSAVECTGWKPIYDYPSAIRDGLNCVLTALEMGQAVHTTLTQVADGGGDCAVIEEFYAGPTGAYVWRSFDDECDASSEPQTYELHRCELRPTTDYTACLANQEPPTGPYFADACDDITEWVVNCVPVDEPTCP